MTKRKRRHFNEEFKRQIVMLHASGKSRSDLIREYDLTPSAIDRWLSQYNTSGSFKEKDQLTDEQQELIKLRKELKQLQMENDILKQAALIIGRKYS
jgi:transposase